MRMLLSLKDIIHTKFLAHTGHVRDTKKMSAPFFCFP